MQPVERVRGDYGSLVIAILSSKLEIIGVAVNGGKVGEKSGIFVTNLVLPLGIFVAHICISEVKRDI